MYFIRPEWLRHGSLSSSSGADRAIFSVDLSDQRLATAGQDCRVRIWHLPTLQKLAKDVQTPSSSPNPNSNPSNTQNLSNDQIKEKENEKLATKNEKSSGNPSITELMDLDSNGKKISSAGKKLLGPFLASNTAQSVLASKSVVIDEHKREKNGESNGVKQQNTVVEKVVVIDDGSGNVEREETEEMKSEDEDSDDMESAETGNGKEKEAKKTKKHGRKESHAGSVIPEGALLATLSDHAGAVNCVRWNSDGSALASCGDDGVVLIYDQHALRAGTGSGFGGNAAFSGAGVNAKENWRCRRPLRGHNGDVTDIAWSPDGERLASAGVDNTVIVWDVRKEFEGTGPGGGRMIQRLEGHRGLVKGVCWDPVGKFLASQSDDRSIVVWRTSDWKAETTLRGPLQNAVLHENNLTLFLRLSWSPCGSAIVGTNGLKKPNAHVAAMFFRDKSFSEMIEFVGHAEPVVCSRFSPRLYTRNELDNNNSSKANAVSVPMLTRTPPGLTAENAAYVVVALGSKDHGATVWRAGGVRPFYNMADMFDGDVMDLSWAPDGYSLAACSADGRVMYMKFDATELGHVLCKSDENRLLSELWRSYFGGVRAEKPVPESPAQLELEAAASAALRSSLPVAASTGIPVVSKPVTALPKAARVPVQMQSISGQREMRVAGGKRRIIPAALPEYPADSVDECSVDNNGAPNGLGFENLGNEPASKVARFGADSLGTPVLNRSIPFQLPPTPIQPMIAAPMSTFSLLPGRSASVLVRELNASLGRVLEAKPPSAGHSGGVVACVNSFSGTIEWRFCLGGRGAAALACIDKVIVAVGTFDGYLILLSPTSGRLLLPPLALDSPPYLLDAFYYPQEKDTSQELNEVGYLAVITRGGMCCVYDAIHLKLMNSQSILPLLLNRRGMESISMESTGMLGGNAVPMTVTGSMKNVTTIPTHASTVGMDPIATTGHAMDSDRVASGHGSFLGEHGSTETFGKESLRSVIRVSVTRSAQAVVTMSDGHAFVYYEAMGGWMRIADDMFPNSEFFRPVVMGGDGMNRMLGRYQAFASTSARNVNAVARIPSRDLRKTYLETVSHLETLIRSSILIESAHEYRYYVTCYAAKLGNAPDEDSVWVEKRAIELCEELNTSGDILGLNRTMLLKNVILPVLSTNRKLQHVTAQFNESRVDTQQRVIDTL